MILGQDSLVLTDTGTASGYVLTRAQAREKTDPDYWSELPYSCQGGKPKKAKAEKRRAKVVGTSVSKLVSYLYLIKRDSVHS